MHILWLVNTLLPEAAEGMGLESHYGGSWLEAQMDQLRRQSSLRLTVVSLLPALPEPKEYAVENRKYVAMASGSPEVLHERFQALIARERPDIVHIFGTEYAHSLAMMEAAGSECTLVSVQGLVHQCEKVYLAGMAPKYEKASPLKRAALKVLPVHGGVLALDRQEMAQAAVSELELLQKTKYIAGRTQWDKESVLAANPNLHYFHLGEIIRPVFYAPPMGGISPAPHSIFVSQGSYPLKGLHFLLEALPAILKEYPDTTVRVAGQSIYTFKNPLKMAGVNWLYEYQSYIKTRIHQLGLEEVVQFTGPLDAELMCRECEEAAVFLLPSALENSPNSLGEAMLLARPCVASRVGGVPSMVEDGSEALLYPYNDTSALTRNICRVFAEPDLAHSLGENARLRALKNHDPEAITDRLLEIYREISNS